MKGNEGKFEGRERLLGRKDLVKERMEICQVRGNKGKCIVLCGFKKEYNVESKEGENCIGIIS